MNRFILPASLLLAAIMGVSSPAQEAESGQNQDTDLVTLTPEVWYYKQQLEKYNDPKVAVRRNAEFRAAQRMARLESMSWFGFSNARPVASPTPFTSMYSPAWQSNWHRPYAWYTSGRPTVVVTGRGD
jgi:hypothetical protein